MLDGGCTLKLTGGCITAVSYTHLAREVGSVLTVADGIAYVEGLEGATYGEILLFEGVIRGMVQELRSGRTGCILFGRVEEVSVVRT